MPAGTATHLAKVRNLSIQRPIWIPWAPIGRDYSHLAPSVWTGITMNVHFPAPQRQWPSRLVNLAVAVVVLALAAATFVLSYPGLHAIVSQAGVPDRLARIYPGLFDAVFVVACVAAVVLRDARWWARLYAWLVIILVVAVVGAADAVHAMNVTLPHRKLEGVVAATPWVLVLLGFILMLTVLRQSRAQHAVAAPAAGPAPRARELPPAPEAAYVLDGVSVSQAGEPEEILPVAAETGGPDEILPPAEAGEPAERAEPGEPGEIAQPAETVAQDDETPAAGSGTAYSGPGENYADSGTDFVRPGEEGPVPVPAPDPDEAPTGEGEPAAREVAATREESLPPAFLYWQNDEETGPAGQDHPPTVPSSVIDDDAPPFATAPFATIPRLNRVRSTPTPPEEDDEAE